MRRPRQAWEKDVLQARSLGRPAVTILVGLLVGWLVVAVTIDRVFARRAPALALRWNPGSADANVRMADTLLQDPDTAAVLPAVADHAARSLRRQPLNPGGARLLAIAAASGGNIARAGALARYAEVMSRRDLPTQLWLIEAAVQRGDIATALVHYDRAMKTSAQGRAVLFPILTQAASDPAIWRPLAGVLARRPQWWRDFTEQLVPRSSSPDALYAIARRTGIERPGTADPALLQAIEKRLVDLGAYSVAADLWNRAHGLPPASPALLRNGGFEQPGGWDPFEWNLQDTPDLAAVRQPGVRPTGGSALFITAANGRGGDVAAQLVILSPGRYVMTATTGDVRGDPLAFPRFVVRCANGPRDLLNAPFPASPEAGRAWRAGFTVPAGCPAQRVGIRGTSSLDPSDAVPWVDSVAIRREGN